MRKKQLVIIFTTIVLVVGALGIILTKSNSNYKEKSTKTYSKNQDDKLTIEASAEITNAEDARKTAVFFKEDFMDSNKEKITSENSKKVQVLIKGKYKSWLYDETGSVEEVDVE